MPITKNDLINETAILCGITRDDVRIAIEQFFNAVKDSIKNGAGCGAKSIDGKK